MLEGLEDRTLLTLSPKYLTLLQGAEIAVELGQNLATSTTAQLNVPIVSEDLGEISKIGDLFEDTFEPIVDTLTTLRDDAANQDAAAETFLGSAPFSVMVGAGSAVDVIYEAAFNKMAGLTGASDPLDMGFGGANPYISQASAPLFNGTIDTSVLGTFRLAFGVTSGGDFYLGAGDLFDSAQMDLNATLAETSLSVRELPFSIEMGGSAELGLTFDASLNQTLIGEGVTAQALIDATTFSLGGTAGLTGEMTATVLGLEMVGWTANVSWNLATSPEDPGDPAIEDQTYLIDKATLTNELVDRLIKPMLPADLFDVSDWGLNVQDLMQVADVADKLSSVLGLLSLVTTGDRGNTKGALGTDTANPENIASMAGDQANNDDSRWELYEQNLAAFALGQNVDLVTYTYDPEAEHLYTYESPDYPFFYADFYGIVQIIGAASAGVDVNYDYGLKVGLDAMGAFLDTDVTEFRTAVAGGAQVGLTVKAFELLEIATGAVGLAGGPFVSVGITPDAGSKRYVMASDLTGGLPSLSAWLKDSFVVGAGVNARVGLNLDVNTPVGAVLGVLPDEIQGPARDLLEAAAPYINGAQEIATKAIEGFTREVVDEVCSWDIIKEICRVVGVRQVADEVANQLTPTDYLAILDALAIDLGILSQEDGPTETQTLNDPYPFPAWLQHKGLFAIPTFGLTREKGFYTWSWDLVKDEETLSPDQYRGTADPSDNDPAEDMIKWTFENGVLSITGTDDKNSVAIVDQSGGVVQLQRSTTLPDGTVVNDPIVNFSGVTQINVALLGEDDTYTMTPSLVIPTTVDAGAGDDSVSTGAGSDSVSTGAGEDTVNTFGGNDVVFVQGESGFVQAGEGNDTVYGGSGDDSLFGGGGDDYIEGRGGDDQIFGGAGFDTLDGGFGDDSINGGDDSDTIYSGLGSDTVDAGDGDDFVYLSGLNNLAYGGPGNDSIYGGNFADFIFGEAGNDYIDGGSGNDFLSGGEDDDIIEGGNGDDGLFGGSGNDYLYGGQGNDALDGEEDDDALYGGDDSDSMTWNALQGNDILEGGTGRDTLGIVGTPGTDDLRVRNAMTEVLIQFGATTGQTDSQGQVNAVEVLNLQLDAGADTVLIESLQGTGVDTVGVALGLDSAADLVRAMGTNLADVVRISRSQIPDPETSTPVDVALIDGLSSRLIIQQSSSASDVVRIDGSLGDDDLKASVGVETLIGVTLDGGDGDDILSADAILLGGPGDDLFYPAAGNNIIDGGDGFDVIVVDGNNADNTIRVDQAGTIVNIDVDGQTSSNDTTNVERIDVNGYQGNDAITLAGLLIPALVIAGEGNDTVNASAVTAVPLTIHGGEGNDVLIGGAQDDLIHGGQGNDRIAGGAGQDTLFGEEDADTFEWAAGDGDDVAEGGQGQDLVVMTGLAAASNRFELASSETDPARGLARWEDLAAATGSVDFSDVEQARLIGGTQPDLFTVQSLVDTDLSLVDLQLGGDTLQDIVRVFGSDSDDLVTVTKPGDGRVNVNGLSARVRLFQVASADVLNLLLGAGNDQATVYSEGDNPSVQTTLQFQIQGGLGNDRIEISPSSTGSPIDPAILIGNQGDDTLIGGDGPDILLGGPGNDTLIGNGGDDRMQGDGDALGVGLTPQLATPFLILAVDPPGGGNDTLYGNDGNDLMNGGEGDDLLYGGAGDDQIGIINGYLEPGNDRLVGGAGNDQLRGGIGNDVILGGHGQDTLQGNDGTNTIVPGATDDDVLYGDADAMGMGADFFIFATDPEGGDADLILGDTGNDRINGGAGDDQLFGNDGDDQIGAIDGRLDPGNDVIQGNAGNDSIQAGDGDDWVDGDTPGGTDAGNDHIWGNAGNDLLHGNLGDDVIEGNDGNDAIVGNEGNDFIAGGLGNDTIAGNEGHDTIAGDDGDDLIFGNDGLDVIFAGAGLDVVFGNAGDDLILGGPGNDTIQGNEGNDWLNGEEGDDHVVGGLGADQIYGGAGNDRLCGGLAEGEIGDPSTDGNDYISGGDGDDALVGDFGNDLIFGDAGNDQLWGSEGDDGLDGGDGNDALVGGLGNDFLFGGHGDDFLFGLAGDDTLWGGFGNDLMYGGDDNDVMLGGDPTTANTVHAPRNPYLPFDGDDVMLGGFGSDHVDGGNGNNLLDAGDDGIREVVLAGVGNDIGYSHLVGGKIQSDVLALDGGDNNDLHAGELLEPPIPAEQCMLVDFAIDASYYTGQKILHDGSVVQHPPLRNRRFRPGASRLVIRSGSTTPDLNAEPSVRVVQAASSQRPFQTRGATLRRSPSSGR